MAKSQKPFFLLGGNFKKNFPFYSKYAKAPQPQGDD